MNRRSTQSPKSRLFAATFILTFVLGFALFFITHSYVRLVSREKNDARFREATYLLPSGYFKVNDKNGSLDVVSGDYKFELTINPELQDIAEKLLKKYDPVIGAFVLMDSSTGEILTMAAYSRKRRDLPFYSQYMTCLDPELRNGSHPMASIAKLVTASAAIEHDIAGPGDKFQCTGKYVVKDQGSVPDPDGVKHGSISMGKALAASCNPVFAQIGLKVGKKYLEEYYAKFMFNRAFEFDMPVIESGASIGDSQYSLARSGAGYDGTWMSPVHAAAIAATFRNDGVMMRPYMVRSFSYKGRNRYYAQPEILNKIIGKKTAKAVSNMMSGTVNSPGGTAYRGFYKNGRQIIRGMEFAGKTGSINGNSSSDYYTWFVGHTEKGERPIAFTAMIVNDGNWKIKAASYTGQFFMMASEKIE